MLNLDVTIVPYRGPSELSIALIRKDVDSSSTLTVGFGKASATSRYGRSRPQVPRVSTNSGCPTMAEAGVSDFEISSWNALYAPARAPDPASEVIRQAATEILSRDDVKSKFREIGFVARPLPPAAQDETHAV